MGTLKTNDLDTVCVMNDYVKENAENKEVIKHLSEGNRTVR